MKNRKQKLLTSILIPTTALAVVGGTIGVIAGIKMHNADDSHFLNPTTIKFSAGDGHFVNNKCHSTTFEAGTSLDRIDQPEVSSNKKDELFAGWMDEKGQMVHGNQTFRKDAKLTATFKSNASSEYATISFKVDPKQPGPVLQGNQTVSVNKGYFFFMVNRPSAKWVVKTKEGSKTKYFKGWAHTDGTLIQENEIITSDITLYPVFNEAVTITFDPDGKVEQGSEHPTAEWTAHPTITRGQAETTLETGTVFNKFNQPSVECTLTKEGETKPVTMYFAGWYKEKDCTTPWDESELVNADATAFAKWTEDPTPSEQFGLVTFNDPRSTDASGKALPTMTYDWSPSSAIVVKLNDKTWGKTNKPTVNCYIDRKQTLNYKIASWEIKNSDNTWSELSDDYQFPLGTQSFDVRPVLTYAIDSLTVYSEDGSNTIDVEDVKTYKVQIVGGSSSESDQVTWSLVKENDGTDDPFPQAIAQIDETGVVTAKSCSREVFEQEGLNHFYVKAVSKLDTKVSNYYRVDIKMPYTGNLNVWMHTEVSESSNPRWYSAPLTQFTDPDSTEIVMTGMDGSIRTIQKSDPFYETIVFGTDIGTIPDNFLAGWTNFQGNIDLANSKVVAIGDQFMANCINFNGELNLNNVYEIGANFLKGCTSFNTAITFKKDAPLYQIGEAFMMDCTSFDQTITLPQKTGLTINNAFMKNCTSFNQDFEIPNNVVKIHDSFMQECTSFTSKLIVNAKPENITYSDNSLSTVDSSSEFATTGFSVAGNNADDFKKEWTDLKGPIHYRTIRETKFDGKVSAEQFKNAKKVLGASYNFECTLPDGSLVELDDTMNAGQAGFSYARLNDGEGSIWYKAIDADHPRVVAGYSDNGRLFSLGEDPDYQVYAGIDQIHMLLNSTSATITDWTFDETDRTYSILLGRGSNRLTLRFGKDDNDIFIEYMQYDKYDEQTEEWEFITSFSFANIDQVSIADQFPKEAESINTATWDSTSSSYVHTTTEAMLGDLNFALRVDIDSTTASWKGIKIGCDKAITNNAINPILFDANGKQKEIAYDWSTTNQTWTVVPTEGFANGDILLVNFETDETAGLEQGAIFTATEETSMAAIKWINDSTTLVEGDQAFISTGSAYLDWDTAVCEKTKTGVKYNIEVVNKDNIVSSELNYAAGAGSYYSKDGGTTKVYFGDTNSGITVNSTGVGTHEVKYEIAIDASVITANTSFFIEWNKSTIVTSSFECGTLSTVSATKFWNDAEYKQEIKTSLPWLAGHAKDIYLEVDGIDSASPSCAIDTDTTSGSYYQTSDGTQVFFGATDSGVTVTELTSATGKQYFKISIAAKCFTMDISFHIVLKAK